jgi:hypothetical protein
MISVRDLCRRRQIGKLELPTPIFVPSLSSKGFPEVQRIASNLSEYLIDVAMISTYDVHYGYMPVDLIRPNTLFIDSGGFEARSESDFSDEYPGTYQPRAWTRDDHLATVSKLDTFSSLVLISFDEPDNGTSLLDQLSYAKQFFAQFPEAVSDFLVKPHLAPYVEVAEVIRYIPEFANFDILGFTEKELGASLADRLLTVAQMRLALTAAGLATPIHVFGCLDPLTMQLFFLCGADVFDGLSWLRFGYHNSLAVYRNNWTALVGSPTIPYDESRWLICSANLTALSQLKKRLGQYAERFERSVLESDLAIVERVLNIVNVTIS